MKQFLENIGIGIMVAYAVLFFCVCRLFGVRLEDEF